MKLSHIFKIPGYMYELHKRNFSIYFKKRFLSKSQPIVKNSIQWVGHSTTVINMDGVILATDPVTNNWLGHMKRKITPSMDLSKISLDYILLSHGHKDHIEFSTLKKLNKDATVIAPYGFSFLLKTIGYKNVVTLNPDNEYKDDKVCIKCIEAKHDGRRYYIGNKRSSVSNAYVVKRKNKSIFFPGDTAYSSNFKDIHADVALMPVGCYKPDDFQKMHCTPEQSFKMFKESKCKTMIPIHYKTFVLAQDDDNETIERLNKINDGSIDIIDIGSTVKF